MKPKTFWGEVMAEFTYWPVYVQISWQPGAKHKIMLKISF